ncbi:MAG TPA: TM2 domain-containing protein [Devosia sp.]|nr:TM2 domain-containing protein [Devosia sp.]
MANIQEYSAQPVPLGANMHYCTGCGRPVHDTALACPHCGAAQATIGSKSRIAAALLAFFLGGLGIHKFYLGQVGWGFLYLIFCWTFIPAIAAFVEFIIYLTMSDQAFAAKYH